MINVERFVATLLDHFFCLLVPSIIFTPFQLILGVEHFAKLIIPSLIVWLLAVIFKDFLFKGQSLGKKIIGIKVVMNDGKPLNLLAALLRAIPLILVPIELIMIITQEKRIGDYLAKTKVVSVKDNTGDGSLC